MKKKVEAMGRIATIVDLSLLMLDPCVTLAVTMQVCPLVNTNSAFVQPNSK